MKTIFRLLCGWMAIALTTACSHEELLPTEPVQKPAEGKMVSVKAYTPSEQPASRLAFDDQGTEGLKLSWSEGDAFTAVVGNDKVTFTYDANTKEFSGTLPDGAILTDETKAYYPAYEDEYTIALSQQTGALNSATTYMEGAYDATAQAFRFTHSTAILKVAFSGLPQNAEISSVGIDVVVGENSFQIAINQPANELYINLPAIPKDGKLTFDVRTSDGTLYTSTQTVKAEGGIKVGVYYNTTVALSPASVCKLPKGSEFNAAIKAVDGYGNATSIVFKANDTDETPATRSGSNYTISLAGNVLTISTPLSEFVFNADCTQMFYNLTKIQSIDFGNSVNTANVTDMYEMFSGCQNLTSLDLSNFDFSKVQDFDNMFYDLGTSATNQPIPVYVTQAGYNILKGKTTNIVSDTQYAVPGHLPTGSDFNNAVNNFLQSNPSLTKIKFIANSNNTNTNNPIETSGAYMVAGSDNTLEIHTAAAEFVFNADCSGMFYNLTKIQSIDFGNCVKTGGVTDMYYMFATCKALTSLDLWCFDTAVVNDMSQMFLDCSSLTSLNVSSFNTAKVTDMSSMFFGCSKLTSLDLFNFDTSKVTTMDGMFYECLALTVLDLRYFNFKNVTDFDDMFYALGRDAAVQPVYIYVKDEKDKAKLDAAPIGIANYSYAEIHIK